MAKEKVVLAYSGGLDTSIIISWLIENYDCEVIAVCGDVGQGKETDGLEERALKSGASKIYIEDLRDEYVEDFIFPTLKAGAIYEGKDAKNVFIRSGFQLKPELFTFGIGYDYDRYIIDVCAQMNQVLGTSLNCSFVFNIKRN